MKPKRMKLENITKAAANVIDAAGSYVNTADSLSMVSVQNVGNQRGRMIYEMERGNKLELV